MFIKYVAAPFLAVNDLPPNASKTTSHEVLLKSCRDFFGECL